MRTAIDRMSIGKEKEVDILAYDGIKKNDRFVCPECGEYVFTATGKRNSFKHRKGEGLECDRRVDGTSKLTFYERVGLPIYLIKETNTYSLNIGFYALGSKIIEIANGENISVIINNDNQYNYYCDKYLIDSTSFYENDITIKQINFIPENQKNYKIELSNKYSIINHYINNKWSDYADGFSKIGAVFSYSENKGKKIRKNDTITTDTSYYVLLFNKYQENLNGLEYKEITYFKVGSNNCFIYKIKINTVDEKEFGIIENYFWVNFKLKLLYNKPELVQIWPPAFKVDDVNHTIPLKSRDSIFVKLNSDADIPVVYRYFNTECYKLDKINNHDKCKYIKVNNIDCNLLPLSIDRKYLANAQFFTSNNIYVVKNNIKLEINDLDLFNFENEKEINKNMKNKFNIKSNIVLSVLQISNNYKFLKNTCIANDCNEISLDKDLKYLYIYTNDMNYYFFKHIRIINTENHNIENININLIIKLINTPCIDIPFKYRKLYVILKGNPYLNKILKKYIVDNKIPIGVLKLLINGGFLNE